MSKIQSLFNRMVGLSVDELERQSRIRQIYAQSTLDVSTLSTPAVWRRRRRVSYAWGNALN